MIWDPLKQYAEIFCSIKQEKKSLKNTAKTSRHLNLHGRTSLFSNMLTVNEFFV